MEILYHATFRRVMCLFTYTSARSPEVAIYLGGEANFSETITFLTVLVSMSICQLLRLKWKETNRSDMKVKLSSRDGIVYGIWLTYQLLGLFLICMSASYDAQVSGKALSLTYRMWSKLGNYVRLLRRY